MNGSSSTEVIGRQNLKILMERDPTLRSAMLSWLNAKLTLTRELHQECKEQTAWVTLKLLALVYDILPSTTAVFSYAIGSRKLSANEQFFVGAQTVVCYKQLKLYQAFVLCCHVAYTSSNKTRIV